MPTKKFTDRSVASFKAKAGKRTDFWDDAMPGFGIRVSEIKEKKKGGAVDETKRPKFRRTWVLMYWNRDGKKKRYRIGGYPNMSPSRTSRWHRGGADGSASFAQECVGDGFRVG